MITRLRRSWLVVPALLALTFLALSQTGAAGQPTQAATPRTSAVGQVAPVAAAPVAAPHGGAAPAAGSTKKTSVQPASRLADHVTQDGVNMRACASTSCAVVGTANVSHSLRSWCYVSGQSIFGNPFWDIVYNATTGIGGFISEFYLPDKSQGDLC